MVYLKRWIIGVSSKDCHLLAVLGLFMAGPAFAATSAISDLSANSRYCGPDCIYVLGKLLGNHVSYETILSDMKVTDQGVSLEDLKLSTKRYFELDLEGYELSLEELYAHFRFPALV